MEPACCPRGLLHAEDAFDFINAVVVKKFDVVFIYVAPIRAKFSLGYSYLHRDVVSANKEWHVSRVSHNIQNVIWRYPY